MGFSMEILVNLTVQQIEAIADQLKANGFIFDDYETDNDTYAKIVQAVFDGLQLEFDEVVKN